MKIQKLSLTVTRDKYAGIAEVRQLNATYRTMTIYVCLMTITTTIQTL